MSGHDHAELPPALLAKVDQGAAMLADKRPELFRCSLATCGHAPDELPDDVCDYHRGVVDGVHALTDSLGTLMDVVREQPVCTLTSALLLSLASTVTVYLTALEPITPDEEGRTT